MKTRILVFLILVAAVIAAIHSCKTHYFRNNYDKANSLLYETDNLQTKPYLKAHLTNGDVCILRDSWEVDTVLDVLSGFGIRYNINRAKISEGKMSFPIDSVSIFETNNKIENTESGRIIALAILTGVHSGLAIFCLINPKACFGSCPTFYVNEGDYLHYADAEGFSSAITPSLEYADIDALNNESVTAGSFSVTMKNEALETHCVNEVKLLAYPRKAGERIYHTPTDDFFLCENIYPLTAAKGDEGDITTLLKDEDRQERFSLADENNLESKEEIFLTFNDVKHIGDLGLILSFRQSLMSTYLFYSAMEYMGNEVSDMFAILERDAYIRGNFDASAKLLGGIRVYLWNALKNTWEFQNEFYETGPIAINKQFIPLTGRITDEEVRLKLILNRGTWRIDYVALTNIKKEVEPVEVFAEEILHRGKDDQKALADIANPDRHLISMPGSEYKFKFTLPGEHNDFELFLYSKGYYLEWMRDEWLNKKDLFKLKQMVFNPEKYLRNEAKHFKKYESTMEEVFWNSKIDTKTFSHHEN